MFAVFDFLAKEGFRAQSGHLGLSGEVEESSADGVFARTGMVLVRWIVRRHHQFMAARFFDELLRVLKGGEVARDAIERRFSFMCRSLFLLLLERFPLRPNCVNGFDVAFPKDMWMAMYELVDDALGDLIEIECVAFGRQLAVKHNLKEKVA